MSINTEQISAITAGGVAVTALKMALDQAGVVDGSTRASLIGYFINEWNQRFSHVEYAGHEIPSGPMNGTN